MGNQLTAVRRKELAELLETTSFTQDEIFALYQQFEKISASREQDGVIDKQEFKEALGFKADSVFLDRVFNLFDENHDGSINFREFLMGLTVFSPKGKFEDKLRFSFNIYDVDRDGSIDKAELYELLKASLIEHSLQLPEAAMRSLVDTTFAEADLNGDGKISFDEYEAMVRKHPIIIANMTINSNALVQNSATAPAESNDQA